MFRKRQIGRAIPLFGGWRHATEVDARGSRKKDRKKRLAKGVEEQALGEERLDEIGTSWEARTIEVDDVIYI